MPPRFVVDAHLGRLAKYLRMLGLDAAYGNDPGDPLLESLAYTEERILLSRDKALLDRAPLDRGYFVRATDPEERLQEVADRFQLRAHLRPFTRCLTCNTPLEPVAKEEIEERLPPRTAEAFDEYFLCPQCDQVIWKGSHYDRMKDFLERVLDVKHEA